MEVKLNVNSGKRGENCLIVDNEQIDLKKCSKIEITVDANAKDFITVAVTRPYSSTPVKEVLKGGTNE